MTLPPVTIATFSSGILPTVIWKGEQTAKGLKWRAGRWPKEATQTLFVGDKTVTPTNGFPIYPGETFTDENLIGLGMAANAALYGTVAADESATVRLTAGN